MTPLRRYILLGLAVVSSFAATCRGPSPVEITRERAIEIARPQVSFTPDSIDATRVIVAGRPIWRVVFRGRLPGQPPGLFESLFVDVDRVTGDIVSVSRT